MVELGQKTKIKKVEFVAYLRKLFGSKIEQAYYGNGLTLYYLNTPEACKANAPATDCPLHIGSWQSGEGWTFVHGAPFIINHRSWYAIYRAAKGQTLIGGVNKSQTSRFQDRADAKQRLDDTIEINGGANNCSGEVLKSQRLPEIFWHCEPGKTGTHIPSVVGGRCSRCGETDVQSNNTQPID